MSKAEDTARRERRVPFMLSDAELAAIDDHRFTHRIGTRAEAIRQLIASGLKADQTKGINR